MPDQDNTPTAPSDIANAAVCFNSCIPPGMQMACVIYLLNQLLGANFTPQQIMDNVQQQGFDCCIPDGMKMSVILYLTWALANDFN